ncbi:amidase signature domain-containing protein [Tricladium varicosporioides]|nr:amidase signature domain-containing protein [Hymenoscyphus varicosporioides]
MSVLVLGETDQTSLVSIDEVETLASTHNITIPPSELQDWADLLSGMNSCAKKVLALPDYYPPVDVTLYPRTDIHRPSGDEETDYGGWATKATIKCIQPKSDELKGKTLAIKDAIAVAGIKCGNGIGGKVGGWIPNVDATLVTRILDAGGLILGKSACEAGCLVAVSDTSNTGNVHNPYAYGYSTGGSSSGSARLVSTGQVDMAIGTDQGGSTRKPSANCGVVCIKPTWGLVPYTGCLSLEATLDHAGPIARNVQDCATLLEVIAGSDGIDDRQPYSWPQGHVKFGEELKKFLNNQMTSEKPLTGIKVGILLEGFPSKITDSNVSAASKCAISKLAELGAQVKEISIPFYKDSGLVWMVGMAMPAATQCLLSNPSGRKQLLFTDRCELSGPTLTQENFDALGPGAQNVYLRGLFLQERFGSPLHARCTNLRQKLSDEYDLALKDVNVLVMPTCVFPPGKIEPKGGKSLGPLKMLSRTIGIPYNTAPFSSSGHPALNLPVGFVPARDDKDVWLPTGLQIVGSKFDDLTVLKVAASWEKANDWKTMRFSGH